MLMEYATGKDGRSNQKVQIQTDANLKLFESCRPVPEYFRAKEKFAARRLIHTAMHNFSCLSGSLRETPENEILEADNRE